MSGMTTSNSDHLIRSELWSSQLKEMLRDELDARRFVRELTDFPDGDVINIPSIGSATLRDYVEDTAVTYDAIDTGNFQFSITDYVSSATYITDKNKQDLFYMNELVSQFAPLQLRAIMERFETQVFGLQSQQTSADTNTINGANHRFWGTGTVGAATEAISVADFAYARFALKKANVPQRNLIAVVDPSVEHTLNTLTNITDVSNNPRWEGIVADSIGQDMSFVKNVYGFDVYTSNYLASGISETVDSVAGTDGVANLFFSAAGDDVMPFVGAWRQQPTVESGRNKDKFRDEYITSARFGLKLYRPENLVVCLTDTTVA